MKARSHSVVSIDEDADELSFQVETVSGWVELLAAPLIEIALGLFFWSNHERALALLCAAGLIWTEIYMFKARRARSASRLTVNSRELIVTQGLILPPNRVVSFKPDEVKLLGYSHGGEDEPSGLYLNKTCVFSQVGREQAEAIVYRIFYKFPCIGCKDETPTSLLHGDDSGITSLGLSSAPVHENPEHPARSNYNQKP